MMFLGLSSSSVPHSALGNWPGSSRFTSANLLRSLSKEAGLIPRATDSAARSASAKSTFFVSNRVKASKRQSSSSATTPADRMRRRRRSTTCDRSSPYTPATPPQSARYWLWDANLGGRGRRFAVVVGNPRSRVGSALSVFCHLFQ